VPTEELPMTRSRLVLLLLLAVAVAALGIGSVAWSANPARPHAGAPVQLRFQLEQMPASALAQVVFASGLQAIGTQTAAARGTSTGTIRVFVAHQGGFAITSAESGPLDATIDEQAEAAKDASAISGQASVPVGATLTVQVNDGAQVQIAGAFSIPLATVGKPKPH
jgi:hypothetical protein